MVLLVALDAGRWPELAFVKALLDVFLDVVIEDIDERGEVAPVIVDNPVPEFKYVEGHGVASFRLMRGYGERSFCPPPRGLCPVTLLELF